MYAADKEAGGSNEPVNSDPRELNGVRGADLVDATTPNSDLAWATTTGRPDVTISVSRKSQPTMSSTNPFESSPSPSLKAIRMSCGSSRSDGPTPSPPRCAGSRSTRGSQE